MQGVILVFQRRAHGTTYLVDVNGCLDVVDDEVVEDDVLHQTATMVLTGPSLDPGAVRRVCHSNVAAYEKSERVQGPG